MFLYSCLFHIVLFGTKPVNAEETMETDESQYVFYIRTIDFDIKGQTRPFALRQKGEFKEGEVLVGKVRLEQYIVRKTQMLINQRSLATASIEYTVGESDDDGRIPVDLVIHTVDTWNMIILPRPLYDSNSGFDITLKARDYNFLGTMNPLRIDLGYQYNDADETKTTYQKHSFNFLIDSDTPFTAFGYLWNVNFDNAFSYTQEEPLYYKNTTGISMDLPYKKTTFTFGFEEGTVVNETNSEEDQVQYGLGDYFADVWYLYSQLYAQWKIPTGLGFKRTGYLTYIPRLEGRINYRPGGELDQPRRGPSSTFSHSFGFDRIDWVENENFRKGASIYIENTNTYNFYADDWNNSVAFIAIGHLRLSKLFGISGRFRYKQWFDDYDTTAGDMLRGIRDRNIKTDTMFSLNLDFPFRLLRFLPSELFNTRKLRLFNFELHVVPVYDMALAKNFLHNEKYEWYFSGGLEAIVFPLSWRSLYLRVSMTWNLQAWVKTGTLPGGDNREIFIGIGHHY
jgi:hypothetical protein